jgi:cytochrome b pre-mRNA-processing protein 3
MGLLKRLFGASDRGTTPQLYAAIVARGRAPHWYVQGAVPDTIDGRFDMIAAILSLVLLRLENEPEANAPSTALAECFIVVGKHMGRMMGMIGGRRGAYRAGLAGEGLRDALVRNVYRGKAPADAALIHVEAELLALRDSLAAMPTTAILAGELPQ